MKKNFETYYMDYVFDNDKKIYDIYDVIKEHSYNVTINIDYIKPIIVMRADEEQLDIYKSNIPYTYLVFNGCETVIVSSVVIHNILENFCKAKNKELEYIDHLFKNYNFR